MERLGLGCHTAENCHVGLGSLEELGCGSSVHVRVEVRPCARLTMRIEQWYRGEKSPSFVEVEDFNKHPTS